MPTLQPATKRNQPLANFFCHVDNFGTGPSVKKMYPKYIFSEGASWRGGLEQLVGFKKPYTRDSAFLSLVPRSSEARRIWPLPSPIVWLKFS